MDEIRCPICSNSEVSQKIHKKTPADFGFKNLEKFSIFSCPNCLSEFSWPRESMDYENISKEYEVYQRFVNKQEFEGQIHHTIQCTSHFKDSPLVYHILSLLNFRGDFLDFGGGSGYMAELARRLGYKTSVIEASKHFINFIHEVIPDATTYISLSEPVNQDKKFDVILGLHVIEHLPYPVEDLEKLHSILSPHGILIVIVPNLDRAYYRFGEIGKEMEDLMEWHGTSGEFLTVDFPPHHLTRFRAESIKTALRRVGFKNIAIGYSPVNAWDLFYTGLGDDAFRFKTYFPNIMAMKTIALFERRLNEMLLYLSKEDLGFSLIALASDGVEQPYLENLISQGRQEVMDTYVTTILNQYGEFKKGVIEMNKTGILTDEKDMRFSNLEWKALKFYYQVRNGIFPAGSKRLKFVKRILKTIFG